MKYDVGQVVVYTNHLSVEDRLRVGWNVHLLGQSGVIIHSGNKHSNTVSVKFNKPFAGGHSCGGIGQDGYCYHVDVNLLSTDVKIVSYEEML